MKIKAGYLCALTAASLYGIMPLVAKIVYENGGNSVTLCVLRFLFSMPFLWVLARLHKKESMKMTKKEWLKIWIVSQGSIGSSVLLYSSYNYISSGTATTLHFIYPVLVLAGCMVLYREKINRIQGICCTLCIIGILCFYTPDNQNNIIGIVIALASGIANAFYIIYYAKSGLEKMQTYKMLFYMSMICGIELAGFGLLSGQLILNLTGEGWIAAVLCSLLFSVIASVLFQTGIKIIGPQKTSILSTFEPITSILTGTLLFHEVIGGRSWVGIVSILISTVFLTVYDKKS